MPVKHLARAPASRATKTQTLGLTHFLGIPLSTSTSRPMISAAYRKIMDDPVSSSIPKPAFCYPEELRIYLGTLSLGTPQRLNQALTLLGSLDLESMLDSTIRSTADYSLCTPKTMPSPHSTLEVTVQGFRYFAVQEPSPEEAYRLFAGVSDRGGFVPRLCADIAKSFRDAKLIREDSKAKIPYSQYILQGLSTKVIETKGTHTTVTNTNPCLTKKGLYRKKTSVFDATKVVNKYRDMIWTEPFTLEQLGIYEIPLQDIIRDEKVISRGYKKTGSVALPGAPTVQPETWFEGARYVKHQILPPSPLYKHKLSLHEKQILSTSEEKFDNALPNPTSLV
ncbi:MAG: hypothetical protein Q9195_009129 [Heterodermia aff. obscurata]